MIKLIVFDLDGTLYDANFYIKKYYDFSLCYLMRELNISSEKAGELFNQNNILPHSHEDSNSVTEYFSKIGLDIAKWNSFRQTNFLLTGFSGVEKVSTKSLEALSKLFTLVLLSNNVFSTVDRILGELEINKTVFSEIVTADNRISDSAYFSKAEQFEALSKKYNLDYCNMLSIGDRRSIDIMPLVKLGGRGILIKAPADIDKIADELLYEKPNNKARYIWY